MKANNHHQEKESRYLKVLRGFRQDRNGKDVPLVQLTGTWIQAAGFYPGDVIEIMIIKEGKLEIKKEVSP